MTDKLIVFERDKLKLANRKAVKPKKKRGAKKKSSK